MGSGIHTRLLPVEGGWFWCTPCSCRQAEEELTSCEIGWLKEERECCSQGRGQLTQGSTKGLRAGTMQTGHEPKASS